LTTVEKRPTRRCYG